MENENIGDFSEQAAQSLLNILAPGSDLISVVVPAGSFSNYTHVLEARSEDGNLRKVIVRRYKIFGNYDRGEKARREFKTFELLNRHQVPAPAPLLLDERGEVLGSPGIVVGFVDGSLRMDTISDPMDWARTLARTLAKIHSIPCGELEQRFLLDGNDQASWFLKHERPPAYMQDYPGGSDLWQLLRDQYPGIKRVPPVLLHIDYWSGNILWQGNDISAVIDWEEASYGDPAVDVGYARMNMVLMGLPQAGNEFLRVYEHETGKELENLAFWELAAAVRPMIDPRDWQIDRSPGREIFRKFIEDAGREL